jgi:MoxR-like ATPase
MKNNSLKDVNLDNIEEIAKELEKSKNKPEETDEVVKIKETEEMLETNKNQDIEDEKVEDENREISKEEYENILRTKVFNLINALEKRLIEREELVRIIVLAILSRNHLFLIGKPGVGKTFAIHLLKNAIKGAKYFEHLIMHDTKIEELFGTSYIDENGRLEYDFENSIVDSELVFLDEMFKGKSEILNALLGVTSNDRSYFLRHQGEIKVPLITLFGASNEFPSDEALDPFDDRLLLRYEVKRIEGENNFVKLITDSYDKSPLNEELFLSLNDLDFIYNEANKVQITPEAAKTIARLKTVILTDGIDISDRKFSTAIRILKMSAYMNGRNALDTSDLFLFLHIGWRNYTDRRKIKEVIFMFFFGKKEDVESKIKDIDNTLTQLNSYTEQFKSFLNKNIILPKDKEEADKLFNAYINNIRQIDNNYKAVLNNLISPLVSLYQGISTIEEQIANNIFLLDYKNNSFSEESANALLEYLEYTKERIQYFDSFIKVNSTIEEYTNGNV